MSRSSGTILAFYQPESGLTLFSLRQSLGDLVLMCPSQKGVAGGAKKVKVFVDGILANNKLVMVTISSSHSGTVVFADGRFVRNLGTFAFLDRYLNG